MTEETREAIAIVRTKTMNVVKPVTTAANMYVRRMNNAICAKQKITTKTYNTTSPLKALSRTYLLSGWVVSE